MRTPNAKVALSALAYASAFVLKGPWLTLPLVAIAVINVLFFRLLRNPATKQAATLPFLAESLLLDVLVLASLVFWPSKAAMVGVLAICLVVSAIFWRSEHSFILKKDKYQEFSLQNSVNLISVILSYLAGMIFSALGLFFGAPAWWSLVGFTLVIFLVSLLQFSFHGIKSHQATLLAALVGVLAAEFFWVAKYLPLSFYVVAASLAIVLYFCMSILRFHALGALNKAIWYRYSLLSFALLFIVLATAHWN